MNVTPSIFTEINDQCGNEHYSRELLMMDIVVPETCWAYKEYNKVISGIYLVFTLQLIQTDLPVPFNVVLFLTHTETSTQIFKVDSPGVILSAERDRKNADWKVGKKFSARERRVWQQGVKYKLLFKCYMDCNCNWIAGVPKYRFTSIQWRSTSCDAMNRDLVILFLLHRE